MSNIPYLEQLTNSEVVTASKAATLALKVKELADQPVPPSVTYPIAIDKGGSGETTQQDSINALTAASSAGIGQVLQINSSGDAVFDDIPAPTLPFKSYMAVISQSGTSDPIVDEGYNDLGGTITWQYFGVGKYLGILSGAFFSPGKTICIINSPSADPDNTAKSYYISSTSAIGVMIGTKTGGAFANELLNNTPIEIRVYN